MRSVDGSVGFHPMSIEPEVAPVKAKEKKSPNELKVYDKIKDGSMLPLSGGYSTLQKEYKQKITHRRIGNRVIWDIKPLNYKCQPGELPNVGLPDGTELYIQYLPDEGGRKCLEVHLVSERLGDNWDEAKCKVYL